MSERLGSLRLVDSTRAEFDDTVTEDDVQQLAGRSSFTTLQCSAPMRDSVWSLLNDSFFALRPDVELRVYGHYSTECDLSFARRMTNVRRFAADSKSSPLWMAAGSNPSNSFRSSGTRSCEASQRALEVTARTTRSRGYGKRTVRKIGSCRHPSTIADIVRARVMLPSGRPCEVSEHAIRDVE